MGTIARLNTAKKKLAQAEQAMPGAYQNNYTDSINQKLGQLADASLTGSTGVDTDALNAAYQQYRANSVTNAQNGAAAAAGTANALAGGYGADWAKTAANQAAGEQIAGVDNSLSSLRADALQNWKQKMSDTTSVLDDLLGQQSLERSEYDGSVSNAQNWRDYLSGRVDTARQENSDFWNNVWTGIKGVGSAVWNGYQNYEKYGQQKLQIQAQGYQMAQDAFNSGNPEQARQIMDMYGLDSTQVDKWTESYTTRQNKVNGLTQALSFAKAGSMDAAREALRQYGLDETILDTWQGMTDVEKDQMDAALNAMNASANGNDSAKNTILHLAGLDTNAVDDFSTVAGRLTSQQTATQEALYRLRKKYGIGSGSKSSGNSGNKSLSSGYTQAQLNGMLKEYKKMKPGEDGYDYYKAVLIDAGRIKEDTGTKASTQSAAGGTGTGKLALTNTSPVWTNGTRSVVGTVSTTASAKTFDKGLSMAQQMTDSGKSADDVVEYLIQAGYSDDVISRITGVMDW